MAKAGRKPMGLTRVNVMLDAETIKRASARGRGNLSAGVRLAFERMGRLENAIQGLVFITPNKPGTVGHMARQRAKDALKW